MNHEQIQELVRRGYRRVSRRFGVVARVDRPDWLQHLIDNNMGPHREDMRRVDTARLWADFYRRVVSADKIELDPPSLALNFPTSNDDPTGYVPKADEATPCSVCEQPTLSHGTGLCDRCWELSRRIAADTPLAVKILATLVGRCEHRLRQTFPDLCGRKCAVDRDSTELCTCCPECRRACNDSA